MTTIYLLFVIVAGSTGTPVLKAEFKSEMSKQDCEFFAAAANAHVRNAGHGEFVHYCSAK